MSGDATAAYDAALEAYYLAVQTADADDELVAAVRAAAEHGRAAARSDGDPWAVCDD